MTLTRTSPPVRIRPLAVAGSFDLRQSVEFGFGQRHSTRYAGHLDLAMCQDGYLDQVGVRVRPGPDGLLCKVVGGDPDVAVAQVARVLSVDVDATGYDDLGVRDPLVGRLQAERPGLRPPLFHSAYEAVCWSLLSARRPQAQGARLRERLATEHGTVLEIGGAAVAAFPTPRQLLEVTEVPGLPAVALTRLHAAAEEARDGGLDTAMLRALPQQEAVSRLRRLPGVGPFYAELVLVRALGHTDVLPVHEPRVRDLAARLTGVDGLDEKAFADLARTWSPWRTWVGVAVRAAGPGLLGDGSEGAAAVSRQRPVTAG